MLEEKFDVLGFFENEIYFRLGDKIIMIKKKLPKEDLILQLKVEPEDCISLRDEILVDASQKPLDWKEREMLKRGLHG